MGIQERLSLEAVSADTLIAAEHLHRYELAAELCAGLRVIDLACGSGYGSAILRETASAVVGVDNDAATIDMARVTIGAQSDVSFVVADAVDYVNRIGPDEWDAIVCLEGIEHLQEVDLAVRALSKLAGGGAKLVISVPNSRAFAEENEFHVTQFGFREAMELFEQLGETDVLYQFLAEGSLIRREGEGELAESMVEGRGEPEYANHFIGCVNLGDALDGGSASARMRLAVAPAHNRYMLGLERANRELWRENAGLARERMGKSGAAAATTLFRLQEQLRERAEQAEMRNVALDAEVEHLRHRVLLLDTPRHVAVERARDRAMRWRPLYRAIRAVWRRLDRT